MFQLDRLHEGVLDSNSVAHKCSIVRLLWEMNILKPKTYVLTKLHTSAQYLIKI